MKAAKVARYALPFVVNPPDSWCFVVPVPKDVNHLAAFMGQMMALSRAYSWGNDAAHTAIDVAAVWLKIWNNLELCPPPSRNGGAEGDELMIRQNPDNPCELQTSIDGTNWCTFADLSKCFPNTGQPGDGTPQPTPGGGCQQYQGYLYANAKWLIPTPVSSGDTLEITAAVGATSDGVAPEWRCPDGTIFFGGLCVDGTEFYPGTDPVPGSPHMSIILLLNGTPYGLVPGPFTVPGGYVNATAEYMLNDSALDDNFGTIQLQTTICNNSAVSFEHTFDFVTSTRGWTPAVGGGACPADPLAVWTPGVGWQTPFIACPAVPYYAREVNIYKIFPHRVLTSVELTFSLSTQLAGASANDDVILGKAGGATSFIVTQNWQAPPSSPWAWVGSADTDTLTILLWGEYHAAAPDLGSEVTLTKIKVTGLGTDPF